MVEEYDIGVTEPLTPLFDNDVSLLPLFASLQLSLLSELCVYVPIRISYIIYCAP